MSYSDRCDWSKCTLCGDCLVKCPVMQMDREEAKLEIARLLNNKEAQRVFRECTMCFNCNNYCPIEGLRPYELILQHILQYRGKAPEYIKYFLNGMPAPNIFLDLYLSMTAEEKGILRKWSIPRPPTKDLLWIGCLGKFLCYDIDHSRVFKDLPKFGPADLCCGELSYRLGNWQAYVDTIERTLKKFEELEIERMVCYCASCYNYFDNILPKVYGKRLPFETISAYQWIWEKVESGELMLKTPLNFTVAVSESCYVSELGPMFWEPLRKLYHAAGAELVELKHHGYDNLSCGTTSLPRKGTFLGSFKEMLKEQRKKYREVTEAGVSDIAFNCPGCFLMMSFTNVFFKKKPHYMLEEILTAYGDTITTPLIDRFKVFEKSLFKRVPRFLFHKGYAEFPRIPIEGPICDSYEDLKTPT